ncbi:MAG TPA: TonB-dependent receptor [Myxococcales bacterium]|nr:TonB-dependent receptor [Myxococcales bacterium]
MKAVVAALLALAAPARAQEMGEDIVVTATRGPQPESTAPAQIAVLPKAQIQGAKALDESLRADPAFATFRRNSSLVADPSSQGVNLRGIGPSGVSRALVLEDGVPLNDGFGGWVYWGSVPRLGVERVEIAPGASSALYGSSALGGVVQVISRPIEDRAELELQGARFGTAQGALSVARRGGRIGAALDAEGLRTDGYGVLAAPGAVDHPASSRHAAARARFEARPSQDVTLGARISGFAEDQDGGTRYTTASAREALAALRIAAGDVEAHAFARWSRFDQQRARVQPDRSSEDLAGTQSAPADDEGASLQWSRGGLLLGADARRVFGRSIEALETGPVASRRTPGEQRLLGAFAQGILQPLPFLRVQAALRFDSWRNLGGIRQEGLSSGGSSQTDLPDRSDTALSPRLALRAQALPWLALRAAAYRSFRAPTLNELYRPFQVGSVRTDANPELGPETLIGAEAGFDTRWLRATAFAAGLRDPIANATLEPGHQMRQNLGSARIRGVSAEARWAPLRALRLSLAYTFTDAVVTSADLPGRALPQDPRHRMVAAVRLDEPRWATLDVALRWTSDQFEDDRNTLRLPGSAVVDAAVSRAVGDRLDVFVAAENLLDRRYLVGLQGGLASVGQPLFVRAGVRARLY